MLVTIPQDPTEAYTVDPYEYEEVLVFQSVEPIIQAENGRISRVAVSNETVPAHQVRPVMDHMLVRGRINNVLFTLIPAIGTQPWTLITEKNDEAPVESKLYQFHPIARCKRSMVRELLLILSAAGIIVFGIDYLHVKPGWLVLACVALWALGHGLAAVYTVWSRKRQQEAEEAAQRARRTASIKKIEEAARLASQSNVIKRR